MFSGGHKKPRWLAAAPCSVAPCCWPVGTGHLQCPGRVCLGAQQHWHLLPSPSSKTRASVSHFTPLYSFPMCKAGLRSVCSHCSAATKWLVCKTSQERQPAVLDPLFQSVGKGRCKHRLSSELGSQRALLWWFLTWHIVSFFWVDLKNKKRFLIGLVTVSDSCVTTGVWTVAYTPVPPK